MRTKGRSTAKRLVCKTTIKYATVFGKFSANSKHEAKSKLSPSNNPNILFLCLRIYPESDLAFKPHWELKTVDLP